MGDKKRERIIRPRKESQRLRNTTPANTAGEYERIHLFQELGTEQIRIHSEALTYCRPPFIFLICFNTNGMHGNTGKHKLQGKMQSLAFIHNIVKHMSEMLHKYR